MYEPTLSKRSQELYDEMLDCLDMWQAMKNISPPNCNKYKEQFGMCAIEMILDFNADMWFLMTSNSPLGKYLKMSQLDELRKEMIGTFSMLCVIKK